MIVTVLVRDGKGLKWNMTEARGRGLHLRDAKERGLISLVGKGKVENGSWVPALGSWVHCNTCTWARKSRWINRSLQAYFKCVEPDFALETSKRRPSPVGVRGDTLPFISFLPSSGYLPSPYYGDDYNYHRVLRIIQRKSIRNAQHRYGQGRWQWRWFLSFQKD